MPLVLPQHILEAFGLPEGLEANVVAENIDFAKFSSLPFQLSVEEAAEVLATHSTANFEFGFTTEDSAPRIFRFCSLRIDGDTMLDAVFVPNESAAFPTAVGKLLLDVWIAHPGICDGEKIKGNIVAQRLRKLGNQKEFAQSFALEWAIACGNQIWGTYPAWVGATELEVQQSSRLFSAKPPTIKFDKLFLNAISETKLKWRFLSLYRIFEHGYLAEILHSFERNFFASPSDAVDDAKKAVGSEIVQFWTLIEKADLKSEFILFKAGVDRLVLAGNKFCIALNNSAKKSLGGEAAPPEWKMGVMLCYKIRCSIVHSGLSAPIVDSFDDGEAGIKAVLGVLELAVLKFLNVRIQ